MFSVSSPLPMGEIIKKLSLSFRDKLHRISKAQIHNTSLTDVKKCLLFISVRQVAKNKRRTTK